MKEAIVTVWRVKAGAFKPATLRPIGGEHPTLRMQGGNKPNPRLTSVSTRYGSTNRTAMPGCKAIRFERPKKRA